MTQVTSVFRQEIKANTVALDDFEKGAKALKRETEQNTLKMKEFNDDTRILRKSVKTQNDLWKANSEQIKKIVDKKDGSNKDKNSAEYKKDQGSAAGLKQMIEVNSKIRRDIIFVTDKGGKKEEGKLSWEKFKTTLQQVCTKHKQQIMFYVFLFKFLYNIYSIYCTKI